MSPFCRHFPERRNPGPPKGAFFYDIQDQVPFFMRQISVIFPSTKSSFHTATKSISSRRHQLFRIRSSSSLPWRCALFFTPVIISGWAPFLPPGTVPHRRPAGPYSYPLQSVPAPSGHGLHPGGRPGSAALFFLSLYLPRYGTVLSCKKEHKIKDREPPRQSFPVSLTTKYITVAGRNVPM